MNTDSSSFPSTTLTFLKVSLSLANKKTKEREGFVFNPSLQN